jgi:hypothetical protein
MSFFEKEDRPLVGSPVLVMASDAAEGVGVRGDEL